MLHNLKAEMARKRIKNTDISKAIKANEKTVRNKIYGFTSFTFPETKTIRDKFFPETTLEYLFEEDNNDGGVKDAKTNAKSKRIEQREFIT